jgi:hypothetical protein
MNNPSVISPKDLMRQSRKRILVLLACSLGMAGTTSARELAAPEIIILHGADLTRQVVLRSWAENHRLLLSAAEPVGAPRTFEGRRSVSVALFYGGNWRAYARDSARAANLKPSQANQHATFYPAQAGAEAVLVYADPRMRNRIRRVNQEGIDILMRYGVATVTGR